MTCVVDPLDTPLSLVRGDSAEYVFTCREEAPAAADPDVAFDLTAAVDGTANRRAIVRFAVKSSPDVQDNVDAVVYKESYRADEVEFLAQAGDTLGQALVRVDKADTEEALPDVYTWDVEVTRQDGERVGASQVGTVSLVAGSKTVVGVGTSFTKAKKYDVFQPLGANIGAPALITKIVSDTEMEVAHGEWSAAAGEALEIRRGDVKTLIGGKFTLKSGVVAQ